MKIDKNKWLNDEINKCIASFSKSKHDIKLGLENTLAAAKQLNLSKPAPYVITVAGTNGKGTVTNSLQHLLVAHGFKTGCYTSPHLINFNERIAINTKPVSAEEIVENLQYIKQELINNSNTKYELTFFELITLVAWRIFIQNNLDIVILEIGLGGRLDAVNTIPKDLAIITSVDYDHQKFLGNTLEQIGYEKAGIIEASKPVILGDITMPTTVLEQAENKASKIYQYGVDYNIELNNSKDSNDSIACFSIKNNHEYLDYSIELNKSANLRPNNVATSLMALQLIHQEYKSCFNTKDINNLLKDFNIVGRCSWLDTNKTVLVDVAHNKQSISNLSRYLEKIKLETNKSIIAICGMLVDKEIKPSLEAMYPVVDSWNFVGIECERGASAQTLLDTLISLDIYNSNIATKIHNNINSCCKLVYNLIKQELTKESIIVIFGSFHIVGPVYEFIQRERIFE